MVARHRKSTQAVSIGEFFNKPRQAPQKPLAKPKSRWWEDAACKDVPVEDRDRIFFPASQNMDVEDAYGEAHSYCVDCPVKDICLSSAIDEEGWDAYGYRGDKDHIERRALHMQRRRGNQ